MSENLIINPTVIASYAASVSNSDGTLTISPTTGAVVASRPAITGDVTIAGGSNASVYNGIVPVSKGGWGQSMTMQTVTTTGSITNFPAGLIKWTGGAPSTVMGIVAPSTSNFAVIQNASSTTLGIAHQNATATAANRIITISGGTMVLQAGWAAQLYYDTVTSRWRVYNVGLISSVSAPLVVNTSSGNLSIPQATAAVSGYLTSTDWNTFNNKVGISGSATAGTVAFFQGNYSTLSSNANFSYELTNARFGVGVPSASLEAVGHFKSLTAISIAGLSATATLTQFTPLGAPTYSTPGQNAGHLYAPHSQSATQTTPNLYIATGLGYGSNAGASAYTSGDVVDYQFWSYDTGSPTFSPTHAPLAGATVSNTGDNLDLTWTDPSAGVQTLGGVRIYRQVNGGGYNDYKDIGAGVQALSDDGTGWTSGSPNPSPLYSDYVANGTTYDYQIWQGGDDGVGGYLWSVVNCVASMTDNNSGQPFQNSIAWTEGTSGTETITRIIVYRQIAGGGYTDYQEFASGTGSLTDTNSGWSSGSPNPSPQYPDFIANGLTRNYTAYSKGTAPDATTIYDATGTTPTAFTDDNSGNPYVISHSATTGSGGTTCRILNTGAGTYYDGDTFTEDTTS